MLARSLWHDFGRNDNKKKRHSQEEDDDNDFDDDDEGKKKAQTKSTTTTHIFHIYECWLLCCVCVRCTTGYTFQSVSFIINIIFLAVCRCRLLYTRIFGWLVFAPLFLPCPRFFSFTFAFTVLDAIHFRFFFFLYFWQICFMTFFSRFGFVVRECKRWRDALAEAIINGTEPMCFFGKFPFDSTWDFSLSYSFILLKSISSFWLICVFH